MLCCLLLGLLKDRGYKYSESFYLRLQLPPERPASVLAAPAAGGRTVVNYQCVLSAAGLQLDLAKQRERSGQMLLSNTA